MHRGCTCLKCTNRPEMHQQSRNASFALLVQQRLLHPLIGTNRPDSTTCLVGAAETAAPPERHQSSLSIKFLRRKHTYI